MEIKTFNSIRREKRTELYNLFDPNLIWSSQKLAEYEVRQEEFMRPDLLMQSLYEGSSVDDLDIILYINDIDNPLSIRPGMKIYYPPSKETLDIYRYELQSYDLKETDVKKQLVVPNKSTRKDPARKDYLENGYSLPPTVLDKPKEPVRIEGDNILIGGL